MSVVDVLRQPVVLGVEDRVDRGQRDVLVAATVTGDEVNTEQLVVVRPAETVVGTGNGVDVRSLQPRVPPGTRWG